MTEERRWTYSVRDARGRTHRGGVIFADTLPDDLRAPEPPRHFQIVLLGMPSIVRGTFERTAVCVPGVPRLHAVGQVTPLTLPRRISELRLPPQRMAEYAAGRIAMTADGLIAPDDVFAVHSDRPRLDRLALVLLEAASSEAAAPYSAVIRHGLKLPPGADALSALEARLSPVDPAAKLPLRAPAVVRLKSTLRRLRDDREPAVSLETLSEDLRFLMLFDARDAPLRGDGMSRLLNDVLAPPPHTGRARIVPLRRPREDA